MNPKWIRRATQALTFLLLMAAPALAIWGVGVTTRYDGADMARRYSPFGQQVAEWMNTAVGDPPEWAADAVVGGTWSIRIFGLELTDPLAMLHLAGAGELPTAAMLLGVGLVLAFQVLLGRAFCGYLCPYGTLARLMGRARKFLLPYGLVHDYTPPPWLRWALIPALFAAPFFGMSLASWILPYLGVSRVFHGMVFGGAAGVAGLVGALLLTDLLLWDHGVCRGVCPSGALQRLVARYRVLHLVALRGTSCEAGCHACRPACWLGLDPQTGRVPDDCDACGRCISVCPSARLAVVVRPGMVRGPVKTAVMALPILLFIGCATSHTPEVVSPAAPWHSPFQAPSTAEAVATEFEEIQVDGAIVSAGVAWISDEEQGLRIFIEEEPDTAWKGPLIVRLESTAGSAELPFDKANAPRSVARPSLYEASVHLAGPTELVIVEGPHAGTRLALPGPPNRASITPVLPPLIVVGLWAVGLVVRRLQWDSTHGE